MNKKAKVLASSVAAIALSSSLIAGSTYALFTSESKVNIAVTSAKVKVEATLDKTYEGKGYVAESSLGESIVAPYFKDGDELVLKNMAAADSVTVKIDVKNYSSIAVQYKAGIKFNDVKGNLSEALEYTVSSESGLSYDGLWRSLAAAKDENGDDLDSVLVTVSLPDGENVNDYMDAECTVSFYVEAVQGNAPVTGRAVSSAEELREALMLGGNVVLEDDIEVSTAFLMSNSATLNLNGHTITNNVNSGRLFDIQAEDVTLTINGEGGGIKVHEDLVPVGSTGGSFGIVDMRNYNNISVIINGGTYEGLTNQGALVKPRGANWKVELKDLTVKTNGHVLNSQSTSNGKLVVNGGNYTLDGSNTGFYAIGCDSEFHNVNISGTSNMALQASFRTSILSGCTFNNDVEVLHTGNEDYCNSALAVSEGNTLDIRSGEYTCKKYGAYVCSSGATLNIYDGKFSAAYVLKADKSTKVNDSVINVFGGSFEGALAIANGAYLNVSGGKFTDANVVNYLVDGYTVNEVVENGTTWYYVVKA